MTREERLELLKQIEKDIYVCSIESTFIDDAKSCAIHSVIEELEQEPILNKIRAEILNDWQIKKFPSSPFSCGLRYAVEIIDKYRGEEDANSN